MPLTVMAVQHLLWASEYEQGLPYILLSVAVLLSSICVVERPSAFEAFRDEQSAL